MDIVAIESKTFEQMKGRFEDFFWQIKNLCGENKDKEKRMFIDFCKYRQERSKLTDIPAFYLIHR